MLTSTEHDRLETALRNLPARPTPSGWQDSVFAEIDRRERRRGLARLAGLLLALLALGALVGWLAHRLESAALGGPDLRLTIEAGDPVRGGALRESAAARGGRMIAQARLGGAGELRVYRDGSELALRCPGDAGCTEERAWGRRRLRGALTLVPGRYDAVALAGTALPDPRGRLEADLASARGAGADVVTEPPVTVR